MLEWEVLPANSTDGELMTAHLRASKDLLDERRNYIRETILTLGGQREDLKLRENRYNVGEVDNSLSDGKDSWTVGSRYYRCDE